MQEMKKRRILIASILKPIDDTRMVEKMACSLAGTKKYEVVIVGFPSKNLSVTRKDITLLPLHNFKRISLGRLIAPILALQKCIKVKPDILIVNTHELLIVAILNRILFGSTIVYDIRENYARNIQYTTAFPKPFRALLAGFVRLKERCLIPFFNLVFLAEKGYSKELNLTSKKIIVLENKVQLSPSFKQIRSGNTRLLFSGTLAESTGVFESIQLAKQLHQLNHSIELMIIGYCPQESVYLKLIAALEGHPFITLIGGNRLVPHPEILSAIAKSDFGIIYYPPSPHVENSMPTKLYEYLGCQLPILLQNYKPWMDLCQPYQAAISIDFAKPDANSVLEQMNTQSFYCEVPTDVTWASEEPKLLNALDNSI